MFPLRDHNPSGRVPYVTYALMAANILIFMGTTAFLEDPRAIYRIYIEWGLVPARVVQGDHLTTVITSMFLHGGWMHLAGNMLFLFIFGDNIEDEMGHVPFAAFYLCAGVAAALLQILPDPNSRVPMVGASGAIAGVMGAYLLLFPKARVDILLILIVFFRIIPVPAWIMLALWFGIQIFGGFNSLGATGGGVAYWAHAGGFVAGVLMAVPLWQRRGGRRFWVQNDGAPPHPETRYRFAESRLPKLRAKK